MPVTAAGQPAPLLELAEAAFDVTAAETGLSNPTGRPLCEPRRCRLSCWSRRSGMVWATPRRRGNARLPESCFLVGQHVVRATAQSARAGWALTPRPAERPFGRYNETASVTWCTSICRSHDVTVFSAPHRVQGREVAPRPSTPGPTRTA